jgi:hypothetical protein
MRRDGDGEEILVADIAIEVSQNFCSQTLPENKNNSTHFISTQKRKKQTGKKLKNSSHFFFHPPKKHK